jgi:hypothetical protein
MTSTPQSPRSPVKEQIPKKGDFPKRDLGEAPPKPDFDQAETSAVKEKFLQQCQMDSKEYWDVIRSSEVPDVSNIEGCMLFALRCPAILLRVRFIDGSGKMVERVMSAIAAANETVRKAISEAEVGKRRRLGLLQGELLMCYAHGYKLLSDRAHEAACKESD